MEEIQRTIAKALPGLPQVKLEKLVEKLVSWSVETTDDLKYVEGAPRADLSDLLPPIQIHKLLDKYRLITIYFVKMNN